MSRHLLFVLPPLFLLIGCTCGPARADNTVRPKNGVDLFVPNKTKISEGVGKTGPGKEVDYFLSLSFVAADGVMVALAEAFFPAENKGLTVGVAARSIETKGTDWAQKAMGDGEKNWATELVITRKEVKVNKDDFFRRAFLSVVAAQGNKIYLLIVRSVEGEGNSKPNLNVNIELTVGEVTDGEKNTARKTITWKKLENASAQLTEQFRSQSLTLSSSPGYAFLVKDEEIVFVIGVEKSNDQTVPAVIRSTGKEDEAKWELLPVTSGAGCSYSFFEWKGKLIKIPILCKGDPSGDRGIKESADMGKTWTDAKGSSSRLWENMREKRDLTTVTIDNRTVLLFTSVSDKKEDTKTVSEIHLGFTDGHRLHDAGPTVTDDFDIFPGGLVHTNGELFSLHQQWTNVPGSITVTRITDKLARIRSTLKAWARNDAYFLRSCEETASQSAPVGTPCVTPMPTDGLVGFLSNKGDATHWNDEYLYLNATVKGGTQVDNGFVFHGTNAGAQWAVDPWGFGKQYNFARHGLTVVATVTIHEVPKDDSPLLTVDGVWPKRRLGLWYGGDEWKVKSEGDEGSTHAGGWVRNEAYRVALVMRDGTLSAYVDGNPVGKPQISEYQGGPFGRTDILIGSYKDDSVVDDGMLPGRGMGDSVMIDDVKVDRKMYEGVKDTDSHVTVTNVLLYNRPLNDTELKTLGERTVEKPKSGNTGDGDRQLSGGDDNIRQETVDVYKKNSAQRMTGLGDSSVRVPAVGVLLFVLSLWGVSGLY